MGEHMERIKAAGLLAMSEVDATSRGEEEARICVDAVVRAAFAEAEKIAEEGKAECLKAHEKAFIANDGSCPTTGDRRILTFAHGAKFLRTLQAKP